MANYIAIAKKLFTGKTAQKFMTSTVKPTSALTTTVEKTAGKIKPTAIENINRITRLGNNRSTKLYNYLPKEAQENFDDLIKAGKRLGYIKTDASGQLLSGSMERFLTVFDKNSYSKMLYLEENFQNLKHADFKKLFNAYKTPKKMAENKENILRWLNVKDKLYEYSATIEKEGILQAEKEAEEIFNIIGIKPNVRAKGKESIYDKLSRKVLNGKEINNLSEAREKIGDLVGTRIVLDDISNTNIQKIVDNICKGIESGKIKVTEIHNYANASKPYFSPEQFEQIIKAAAKKGYEIPRLESEQISLSGYVSAQMNIIHSSGTAGELQIRGKIMNKYGEIEHIPYDIRRGKNIGKNIPELEKYFEPVEDAVTSLKRNGLDKIYDKYILDCYKYIRKYEQGKIVGKFRLPQFPKKLQNYKILKFESLDKIHEEAKKIKDAYEY